jgi:hypothetical protein
LAPIITFHKQHFILSWIITINAVNPTKKDCVVQIWKYHIWINEKIPIKGEWSLANNGHPHKTIKKLQKDSTK